MSIVINAPAIPYVVQLGLKVGRAQAKLLQQIHYLAEQGLGIVLQGSHYIYNTLEDWAKLIGYSPRQTHRLIVSLAERFNVIDVKHRHEIYDKAYCDRRLCLAINQEVLEELMTECPNRFEQNGKIDTAILAESIWTKWQNRSGQNGKMGSAILAEPSIENSSKEFSSKEFKEREAEVVGNFESSVFEPSSLDTPTTLTPFITTPCQPDLGSEWGNFSAAAVEGEVLDFFCVSPAAAAESWIRKQGALLWSRYQKGKSSRDKTQALLSSPAINEPSSFPTVLPTGAVTPVTRPESEDEERERVRGILSARKAAGKPVPPEIVTRAISLGLITADGKPVAPPDLNPREEPSSPPSPAASRRDAILAPIQDAREREILRAMFAETDALLASTVAPVPMASMPSLDEDKPKQSMEAYVDSFGEDVPEIDDELAAKLQAQMDDWEADYV
jgi:hypothetical protein